MPSSQPATADDLTVSPDALQGFLVALGGGLRKLGPLEVQRFLDGFHVTRDRLAVPPPLHPIDGESMRRLCDLFESRYLQSAIYWDQPSDEGDGAQSLR